MGSIISRHPSKKPYAVVSEPEVTSKKDAEHTDHIEFANCIQSHGVLFVIRRGDIDMTVLQVSVNCKKLLGMDSEEILNLPLTNIIVPKYAEGLFEKLNDSTSEVPLSLRTINKRRWSGIHYTIPGGVVLEIEPALNSPEAIDAANVLLFKARAAVSKMELAKDMEALYQIVTESIRDILSYDRILLYTFDPDTGNGRVLAQSEARGDAVSANFVGKQYAAKEIPLSSRCVFSKNHQRIVVDIMTDPVPIVPALNPVTNTTIDMSLSMLRGVSSCHASYVRNMEVIATCVQAVSTRTGELWGLVIGHHFSPKQVSHEARAACLQIGQALNMLVNSKQEEQALKFECKAVEMFKEVKAGSKEELMDQLAKVLKNVIQSEGLAIVSADNINRVGRSPCHETLLLIMQWLRSKHVLSGGYVWHSHSIKSVAEVGGLPMDDICGMLVLCVSSVNQDFVIWFRGPQTDGKRWRVMQNTRASFSISRQKSGQSSASWEVADVAAARAIRSTLTEVRSANELRMKSQLISDIKKELSTGNRKLQTALAEQSKVLESLPSPVFSLKDSHVVVEWNNAAEKAFAIPRNEIVGNDFIPVLVSGKEVDKVRRAVNALLASSTATSSTSPPTVVQFTPRSGVYASCRLHLLPRTDLLGKVCGFWCVCEEQGRSSSTDGSKGRKVGSPNKTVDDMLTMLHDTDEVDKERRMSSCVESSTRSAEVLLRAIQSLLMLSKIRAGALKVNTGVVNIRTVAQEAIDIARSRCAAPHMKAEVSLDVEADLPAEAEMEGGPDLILDIMTNVLTNAIQYTFSGEVSMKLSTVNNASVLRIVIEDTGIGIPEDCVQLLGERFVRVYDSGCPNYGGSGLSLLLAKAVIGLCKGSIHFKSHPEQGTTVTLELPYIDRSHHPAATTAQSVPVKTSSALLSSEAPIPLFREQQNSVKSFSPELASILLVGKTEEPLGLGMEKTVLEGQGHTVHIATTGAGLESIKPPVQLIICDLDTPHGSRTMEEIHNGPSSRKQLSTHRIPIIGVTNIPSREGELNFHLSGGDAYLKKLGFGDSVSPPVEMLDIRQRISAA